MKTCRKCGEEKPLDDFYAHASMPDGHLNQCKTCVKARVTAHRSVNVERIREYDRERGRNQERKAAVKARSGRYDRAGAIRKFREEHPDAHRAHNLVNNAIKRGELTRRSCERCGSGLAVQAHHEDYSKPLEVNWLCAPCHGERHREINEERRAGARPDLRREAA